MKDRNRDPIQVKIPKGHLLRGQFPHFILLLGLLPGVWALGTPTLEGGSWLGLDAQTWFYLALFVPIIQQLGVVLFWRTQLSYALVTKLFGDGGFIIWGCFFMPLLVARPLTVMGLAVADAGSLPLAAPLGWVLGGLLVLPTIWTMHSVISYFGIPRALGGDHFFERYRSMPMVRKGAFAWSSNAMYTFAFLGLWGIALIGRSQAALAVALFQHAYIWVHWYCTEQPDGMVLYGHAQDDPSS